MRKTSVKLAFAAVVTVITAVFLSLTAFSENTPAAPTNILYRLESSDTVRLKWNAVEGADKYYIYKYSDKTGEYRKFSETAKNKKKITGLKPETEYDLAVAAVFTDGGKETVGELGKVRLVTPEKKHSYFNLNYENLYGETDSNNDDERSPDNILKMLDKADETSISENIKALEMPANNYFSIFVEWSGFHKIYDADKELIYDNGYIYFTLLDNYDKETWEKCIASYQKPSSSYYDDDDDIEPDSFYYYYRGKPEAYLFRCNDSGRYDAVEYIGKYDYYNEELNVIGGTVYAVRNELGRNFFGDYDEGCEDDCDDEEDYEKTEEQIQAEKEYQEREKERVEKQLKEDYEKAKKLTSTLRIVGSDKPFFSKQYCEITGILSDDRYLYFLVLPDITLYREWFGKDIGYGEDALDIDKKSYIYRVNKDGSGLMMLHKTVLKEKQSISMIGVYDGYIYIYDHNSFVSKIPTDKYSKKRETVLKRNFDGDELLDICIKNGVLYFKTNTDIYSFVEIDKGTYLLSDDYYKWRYYSYDLINGGEPKELFSLKFDPDYGVKFRQYPLSKEIDNDYIITCYAFETKSFDEKNIKYYAYKLDGSRKGYIGSDLWHLHEDYIRYIPVFWR